MSSLMKQYLPNKDDNLMSNDFKMSKSAINDKKNSAADGGSTVVSSQFLNKHATAMPNISAVTPSLAELLFRF